MSWRLRPNITPNSACRTHWITVGLESEPNLRILNISLKGGMCK